MHHARRPPPIRPFSQFPRVSRLRAGAAIVLALSLGGCVGDLGGRPAGPTGAPTPTTPTVCDDGRMVIGSAPMRRLSNSEYVATMAALFPGLAPELPPLPADTTTSGFENDARALGATDVQVSRWEEIAFRYTSDASGSASALETWVPCAASAVDAASERVCGDEFVREFGLRTHRRPLTGEEAARYGAFFERQRVEIDFAAALQLTGMAMLQSPQFLYRLEIPDAAGASEGVVALDSYEVASRLSFFLWGRMPDETLFAAAARDELQTQEQIEAQARRLLADDRARDAVTDFHRQWLHLDRVLSPEHASRLPALYPDWSSADQVSAREELTRLIEHSVFDGEGTLSSILLSRESFVDRNLAEIYGVAGPSAPGEWAPATLPAGERAGLLTRVGFLAAYAHGAAGSPPLRGVFIMETLLCEPRPSPPPDADVTPPVAMPGEGPRTNRQLFEARTAPAQCQACHVRIDGFGMGFEHYDAIGAFRDTDSDLAVDATSTLVGTDVDGDYDGAVELSERLASSPRVAGCAVGRWVRYASGRSVESADACAVERLRAQFAESGGDIVELLVDIVSAPEFRHRPLEQE